MPCRNCSRYQVEVYFAGHLSLWAGKPHPREILARRSARWLWLAHALAQAVLASVDGGRCGYVVTRDGKVVHHEHAKDEQCNPLPDEAMHIQVDARGTPVGSLNDIGKMIRKKDAELKARIAENLRR